MDINATIIGQLITFAILVWFTMRYVWPPVTKTLTDREKKIAAGLEAADRSKRELEMAEHKALTIIREAKTNAGAIIEQANLHSSKLIEEAKSQAKVEAQRIVDLAQNEIDRTVLEAKASLKAQLATLAVAGAEQIIQQKLDISSHNELLNQLAKAI